MDVHRTRGSPTTLVICFQQAQFVDPYLARLHLARDVTHTDHHHLDLTECRVTQDADFVCRLSGIEAAVELTERSRSPRLGQITFLLQVGEHFNIDVEHILFGPYHPAIGCRITAIIATVGCERQRYLILVIVVLVVAAQTDKHSQLLIFQVGQIRQKVVGMHEHLHPAIAAQVERSLLIDSLRLVFLQIGSHHLQRLLILLD